MQTKELVLVTGGSGYIAVNVMALLLKKGYRVRTTLRTISRADEVREMLRHAGVEQTDDLEFIKADLTIDANWSEAAESATYVIHIASPTPATRPDDADEMVRMAVDGTLRVMKAAKEARVKRVVMTSASGAVIAGHDSHPQLFTEADWTNLNGNIDAYQRSKTMSEQAAWNFARQNDMQLASVLPVVVTGPVLGKDRSHSHNMFINMLGGKMPFLLKMKFDYVDVRDLADLHLLAMTAEQADGQRFLATTSENISYKQLADMVRQSAGNKADKVPTREISNTLVRLLALFVKDLRMPATFLGKNTACSNQHAKELLGWQPRPIATSIADTVHSLIEFNIVK